MTFWFWVGEVVGLCGMVWMVVDRWTASCVKR